MPKSSKIPKKSAAFFLGISVPTVSKYMREGLLPDPLTKEAIFEFNEKHRKTKNCLVCGYSWKAKSEHSRCPKCRSTKTSDQYVDPATTLTIKTTAGLLDVSPSTILRWVKKGHLTNVGTESRILLKRSEIKGLIGSSQNYICYTCKHEWRRKNPLPPIRCSKCGGKRLAAVEKTFPETPL